jgi:hypothetical protein
VTAGQTPPGGELVDVPTTEIGPALLLPDGRVFAVGATGNTAIYTPPAVPNQPGVWMPGPQFPQINGQALGATDGPACLMPNGRVLCVVGPVSSSCAAQYCPPSYFFEFDPSIGTLTQLPNLDNSFAPAPPPVVQQRASYTGRLLLLPTGEVLFNNGGIEIFLYQPDGAPNPAWKPQITSCPVHLTQGQTFNLKGTQLNGLSQANSYGDDCQNATNFPLVQLTSVTRRHVFYCRTTNFSTMGVATGTTIHSADVTVPQGAESDDYELRVIANGIASDPFAVTVGILAQAYNYGVAPFVGPQRPIAATVTDRWTIDILPGPGAGIPLVAAVPILFGNLGTLAVINVMIQLKQVASLPANAAQFFSGLGASEVYRVEFDVVNEGGTNLSYMVTIKYA